MPKLGSTRSGFITVLGRPNVGKSTLVNAILGEKIATVSFKPQTTRHCIRGIHTEERGEVKYQMIFVDTPGLHMPAQKKLNHYCIQEAMAGLGNGNIFLYMVDASHSLEENNCDEAFLQEQLRSVLSKKTTPLFVALNKVDIGKLSQEYLEKSLKGLPVKAILPMVAKKGKGVEQLLKLLRQALPSHPFYFPEDDLTDRKTRDIAGDFIQEQLFFLLGQELPYACTVEVVEFREPKEVEQKVMIKANIHVERDSQKQMVIGRGGSKVKSIGIRARRRLELFLGCGVVLKLQVKVNSSWTKDTERMKRLGYALEEYA